MLRAATLLLLTAPSVFSQSYSDALRMLGAGRKDQALATLKRIVERDPSEHRAYGRILQLTETLAGLAAARHYFEARMADEPDSGYSHYGMALLLRREKAYAQALEHLRETLRKAPQVLPAWMELVQVARLAGRLEEVAAFCNTIDNPGAQFGLGYLFDQTGDWKPALGHLLRAPATYEVWVALYTIYAQYGSPDSAMAIAAKMLEKAEHENDLQWRARAHGRIGVVHNNSDYLKAIDHLSKAVALSTEYGDRAAELSYRSNLGISFRNLGDNIRAAEEFSRALALARETGERQDEGRNLGMLAYVHFLMADYERSRAEYSQALRIAEETGDRVSAASQYGSLAGVYLELGDVDRAIDSATRGRRIAAELKVPWLESGTEQVMGRVYLRSGKPRLAIAALASALEKARSTGNRRSEAMQLGLAAEAHASLGENSKARATYLAALEVAESSGLELVEGTIRNDFGFFLLRTRALQLARDQFARALAVGERTRIQDVIWRAHSGLAAMNDRAGDLNEASNQYTLAIDALERMRGGISLEDDRAGFFEQKVAIFADFVHLLVRRGDYRRAFQYSERSKARALLDVLADSDTPRGPDPPEKQLLEKKIAALQAQIIRARDARSAALQKTYSELADAERQYQDLRRRVRTERNAAADPADSETVTIEQVRSSLSTDAVALEYLLGETESYVFAITRQRFRVVRLPPAQLLAAKVKLLREAVGDKPSRETHGAYLIQARELYRDLVQPVEGILKGKRQLIVVPDGILHYLPFEVLLTRGPTAADVAFRGLPYLIRELPVCYVPSLSVLSVLGHRSRAVGVQPAFAGFGDPDYGARFPRLEASRSELERSARLYPNSKSRLMLGREASETNAKALNLADSTILHFAVHGVLNDKKPQFSGLALSDEGVLQSYEIAGLTLRADMVILSACETALGKAVKGEGLVGLTQAFLHAGSQSVVASLWKVEDRSTSDLMVRLHEQVRNGADKAEALRTAKLSLIQGNTYSHPYYWAPFVLSGFAERQSTGYSPSKVGLPSASKPRTRNR